MHVVYKTPGDSGGQRSLACCSPWGRKEWNMTEQLNNKIIRLSIFCKVKLY